MVSNDKELVAAAELLARLKALRLAFGTTVEVSVLVSSDWVSIQGARVDSGDVPSKIRYSDSSEVSERVSREADYFG